MSKTFKHPEVKGLSESLVKRTKLLQKLIDKLRPKKCEYELTFFVNGNEESVQIKQGEEVVFSGYLLSKEKTDHGIDKQPEVLRDINILGPCPDGDCIVQKCVTNESGIYAVSYNTAIPGTYWAETANEFFNAKSKEVKITIT